MSDNSNEVTLADIKQSQDAIYAALVAILAEIQNSGSNIDKYAAAGTAREAIRKAYDHIRHEYDPKFL